MSPPKAHKEAPPANAAAQASGRNCSSALPDNVLQHMLSFLPAHDAVRTCVFAKSWRHIWNFTTGLLIACGDLMILEFYDFSSFPALEDLELHCCRFKGADAHSLSSQSLRRLSIHGCRFPEMYRFKICAPNLVSLWLEVDGGLTPSLQGMPSLVRAFVEINNYARDSRVLSRDFDCYALDDEDNRCVLLKRLSEAQNLALIPHDIGKMDLPQG
ncbi:unnamed protein product [Urochloa decumbens]|uniref:F-box domain-containing protein n=1 Tax=Urochloa decumbens TaxID=240449 RepID=A0ABC9AM46_9POAL